MRQAFTITAKKTQPPTDTPLATNKDDWPRAKTTVRPEKKGDPFSSSRCSSSFSLYEPCIVDFRKQFGLRASKVAQIAFSSASPAKLKLQKTSSILQPAGMKARYPGDAIRL